jgi:serine/threonine protein kinase
VNDSAADIFDRGRHLGPSERKLFLDGACGKNAALRAEVEQMFAAIEASTIKPNGDATVMTPDPTDMSGQTVGPYRVLQLIGEGGFGSVYMAQQTAPIKRKVALKIVKAGMDTRQVIGRFEAERQALAMMDHPNIARVFDAGATESGRPYFVMELVRGVPITEFCDSQNLSTKERLNLFQAVCHAVLHAHQKGIIHRDLKPSNVMVTLHDGEPVVKVIDFGIAKATNQELTEKTFFTEFRQFIGTPEYMSPEQAAMSGLDVDTRTDIYSMGVLLYELLSGTTPFDPSRMRSAGYEEIQRIIREDEPPRPSTRVTKGSAKTQQAGTSLKPGSQSAEQIAKHRRTDPQTLRRQLSGDLDWIVMKAMEKDRTRRYQTAGALAEDIRRSLCNEPIMARPPSTAYRLRKFARRKRGVLAGISAAVAAMFLAVGALSYGLIQARRERNLTAQRETITRAHMLLSTMNSVRKYTTNNVRPVLTDKYGTEFVREMVPGFSAKAVFEEFAKSEDGKYQDFVYKEAAPNPTNKANLADEFETSLVSQFKDNREVKELAGTRKIKGMDHYYIARPMPVNDQRCLDCHTTPEMAPPKQLEKYGRETGFGWKMGDIVAAQMVYVPVLGAQKSEDQEGLYVLGGLVGVMMIGGLAGLLWLRKA